MERTDVLDKVRVVLLAMAKGKRLSIDDIHEDASVTDDLGINSLKFFELTVALETTFELDKFPIEDWIYAESHQAGPRYTVRSLVDKCMEVA